MVMAMFFTVKECFEWASRIQGTDLECARKERSTWIALIRFCCIQFFIDRNYLPGVISTKLQRHTQPRENTVALVKSYSLDSTS